MNTTTDLLRCRWRAAQLLLAYRDGDTRQAAALVGAMRVEGVDFTDAAEEWDMLAHQFGHRPRYVLAAEVFRVAAQLGVKAAP